MGEYIEKQEATKFIDNCLLREDKLQSVEKETLLAVKRRIDDIPPADVRPVKHGKWIEKQDKDGKTYGVCSNCGYKQYAGHLKYCPECGGKMDGPNQ